VSEAANRSLKRFPQVIAAGQWNTSFTGTATVGKLTGSRIRREIVALPARERPPRQDPTVSGNSYVRTLSRRQKLQPLRIS
jgi:hypothetical protein